MSFNDNIAGRNIVLSKGTSRQELWIPMTNKAPKIKISNEDGKIFAFLVMPPNEQASETISFERPTDGSESIAQAQSTATWGRPKWKKMHLKSADYSYKPTKKEKEEMKQWFENEIETIPCPRCYHDTKEWMSNGHGLTEAVLANRFTLASWVVEWHNYVNGKLGKNDDWTVLDMCEAFEIEKIKNPH